MSNPKASQIPTLEKLRLMSEKGYACWIDGLDGYFDEADARRLVALYEAVKEKHGGLATKRGCPICKALRALEESK